MTLASGMLRQLAGEPLTTHGAVMFYVITGILPDGSVGRRLTCSTKERADTLAGMIHEEHPSWRILVRPTSGQSGSIDIVRDDAPEYRADALPPNTDD